jgi:hypothetical protein
MTAYKFKAGQSVTLLAASTSRTHPSGRFKIVRTLPAERGINLYRIQSANDGHERVVMESEIT